MKEWAEPDWLKELPALAAGYERNVPLADFTTIKVGGPAEVLARFGSWDEVSAFLAWNAARAAPVPLTLLGKGSNVVIRDGGLPGVVAVLGKGLDSVDVRDGGFLYAEAGAATGTAARAAREAGLDGLAFFGGIPGSIGGALRMNAGAYGAETYNDLVKLWLLDDKGDVCEVEPGFVKPRYRHTELPSGWLYKAGLWKLRPGDKEAIRQRMREINQARSTTQPLHMPSSGSWFKNPIWNGEKTNAWKVVDAAGCRGKQVGGAQVSEQHCNFFVNTGNALAGDFELLSQAVEAEILAKLGVVMEREVRFIGAA